MTAHVAFGPSGRDPGDAKASASRAYARARELDRRPSVLIIDDHPIVLHGCRRILQDAGFERVIEARDLIDGYRLYRRYRPEAVIADLRLDNGELGGLALIERIHAYNARTPVLVFSMHSAPALVARVIEAGALGFVNKDTAPAELVKALKQVMAGTPYLSEALAVDVALALAHKPRNPLDDLTPRQLQMLALLAKGKRYGEIAAELNLSYQRVASVCSKLKRKLAAKNLPDLIRIAVQLTPGST